MICILEACDGAGKTYLAHQLCDRYGLGYAHEGPPPTEVDTLEHYGSKLDLARGEKMVFDRLALGERVYGPIYRKEDKLGAEGWSVMTRLMRAVGAKHVICIPSYDTCLSHWRARERQEMFTDRATHRRVYDRYFELQSAYAGSYVYDWEWPGSFDALCAWLEQPEPMLPHGYVGNPAAPVLLVGDRGAKPNGLTPDLPFFGVDQSSGYLTKALEIGGVTDFALVNSWSHRSKNYTPIVRYFPRVVALGGAAHRALLSQSVEHTTIPHPQFWRRFRHSMLKEYGALLREAVSGGMNDNKRSGIVRQKAE